MSVFVPRAEAPLVKAQSLVHLRATRRGLDEAARYYQHFGLSVLERKENAVYLRASSAAPAALVLERGGRDELVAIALAVASDADLARVADTFHAPIEQRHEPGGGFVVRVVDPAGLSVEVVHGVAPLPRLDPPSATPVNTPAEQRRVNAPRPAVLAPAPVARLGHVVLGRQELARNASWYVQTFGLIASDVEVLPDLRVPVVAFLRFDRGDVPTDHHSLVIATAPEDGYLHAAFEVPDIDALGVGAEWLQFHGGVKSWGIGRHVLGSQLFCYHRDPTGFEVEHYADGDVFDASVRTRWHEASTSGLYLWGPTLPPDFVDTRVTLARLVRVIRGLRTREELSLAILTALKRIYARLPRPWAGRVLERGGT